MSYDARRVEYFHTTVSGVPGEAYEVLTHLANLGVNFLALTSVPLGPESVQLTLFPEDPLKLQSAARNSGLTLNGPHPAVLVQGIDEIGALARVHRVLREHGVEAYASSGATDGHGYFGYILYLRAEDAAKAAKALSA
ncbi:MAG: hypothetical protein ACM3JJ_07325 [Hyphomicrobiales bacterium]